MPNEQDASAKVEAVRNVRFRALIIRSPMDELTVYLTAIAIGVLAGFLARTL